MIWRKGLNAVESKQIIAYVGAMSPMTYTIRNNRLLNVSIGGTINKDKLSVLINKREPQLVPILNKAIDNLSENDKVEILNKWVKVNYRKGIDYTLVWQVSLFFSILILLSLFFIFLLRRSNQKLKQVQAHNMDLNHALTQLNETLEIRVEEQIEELERRHILMAQRSRLTEMGEMLSSIAHQWRQPLNRINSNVAAITSILRRKTIDYDMLVAQTQMIEQNTHYMSDTIEDFSNFFHPNKTEVLFNVKTVVLKALELIDQRTKNIEINIVSDQNIELFSFEKEYLQSILIILNNAIDNFEVKATSHPKIDIIMKEDAEMISLSICDNGGGIEEKKMARIFEPYYTTKFAKEGTGLGLYVAKMIIENSMHGYLLVQNKNAGVCFEILTPHIQ